jgi:hypothetical protein
LRALETLAGGGAAVAGKLTTKIADNGTLEDIDRGKEAIAGVWNGRGSDVRGDVIDGVSCDVDCLASRSVALGGAPNVAVGRWRRWDNGGWRYAL